MQHYPKHQPLEKGVSAITGLLELGTISSLSDSSDASTYANVACISPIRPIPAEVFFPVKGYNHINVEVTVQ